MSDEFEDNQAAKLEQLFLEVSNNDHQPELGQEDNDGEMIEIDVLQLPPRSEVHKEKNISFHLTFKLPLIRFISVIAILVTIVVLLSIFYGEDILNFFN